MTNRSLENYLHGCKVFIFFLSEVGVTAGYISKLSILRISTTKPEHNMKYTIKHRIVRGDSRYDQCAANLIVGLCA